MSKLQQLEEQGRDVGEDNFDAPSRKKESTYEEVRFVSHVYQ